MKNCPHCAEEVQNDAKKCKHCGDLLTENKEIESIKDNPKEDDKKLQDFSGWLAIFGLVIFVTPISLLTQLITSLYQSINLVGIFLYIVIIALYVYLIYLMVKKKKIFKKWFIYTVIVQVIITFGVIISNAILYPSEEISDITSNVISSIVYAIVWILYLNNSVRVKNTFVN